MGTETFLTALGGYLATQSLAQYDANGSYLDDPDLAAILFAQADAPDTLCVLSVTGRNEALCQWDVTMAFRATGINTLPVENLADAVADHWRATLGFGTGTWHGGSLVAPATVTLPGGLVVSEVERTARGRAELTSAAKHKGSRFTRSDDYRMTVR
jgi:hypothetical protein